MPETIRDRLRRILNGDPARRFAATDWAARPPEAITLPVDTAARPIGPAAPSRTEQRTGSSVESARPTSIEKPASQPAAVTQPMSRVKLSSDATVPTRPIDPMPPEIHQTPTALRSIKHDSVGDAAEAQAFIENLRQKMASLAEDFAMGRINRLHFESVYAHYREQRQMVESQLMSMSSSAWRRAVAEGETASLLKRSTAKVLSYALYTAERRVLLASNGNFKIDPAMIVPMISAYRSVTAEAYGAGIHNSEIDGGHWLTFVPGRFTTFIVRFTLQPAREQLTMLEDLLRDFETANANTLRHGEIGETQLAAEQFLNLWALGRSA